MCVVKLYGKGSIMTIDNESAWPDMAFLRKPELASEWCEFLNDYYGDRYSRFGDRFVVRKGHAPISYCADSKENSPFGYGYGQDQDCGESEQFKNKWQRTSKGWRRKAKA
jgi:hypothetical protein